MRLPFVVILLTVMIDAMGIGLIMPVMPALIAEVDGGTLGEAAVWGGILSTSFAVMQFLFGPLLGNLSDAYGRKPVILVSLGVLTLDYLIMAVAGSIWLLLAGRILGGITSATHAVASAYMADLSRPHEKAANFGLIGGAFGIGFVLGPLIGGILGEFGARAPFYAAAALAAVNGLVGLFVLPETVTDAIRRPFSWARANPLGAFRQMTRLPGISGLLVVLLIYQVALYVYPSVWAYFTIARFDWSAQMIGLSLALYGIASALVLGLLIRPLLRWWGERRVAIFGHVVEFATLGMVAFVPTGLLLLVLTPIAALGSVLIPALQGIMSRAVPDDAQGELQGVIASVNALAMVISPLVMTGSFAYFTRAGAPVEAPGAPFLLAMALVGVGLALFLRLRPVAASPHQMSVSG